MPETATIPASGKCRSSRHSFFSDAERDMRLDAAAARGRVKTKSPGMEQTEQFAGYSWRRQYAMKIDAVVPETGICKFIIKRRK